MPLETEIKLQVVLLLVQAAAFIGLAVWCLGRGSVLGALGAGLLGVANAIFSLAAFESNFLHSEHLDHALLVHLHAYTVLDAAMGVGAVLLLAAFVRSRRTTAEREPVLPG